MPGDVMTHSDDLLEAGDVLLFKASRALALEQVVAQLQVRRSETFERKKSTTALVA